MATDGVSSASAAATITVTLNMAKTRCPARAGTNRPRLSVRRAVFEREHTRARRLRRGVELDDERLERAAERLRRLVRDARADLAGARRAVQHAGRDLGRHAELDDEPRVDADRAGREVEAGDREALRGRGADLAHQPRPGGRVRRRAAEERRDG